LGRFVDAARSVAAVVAAGADAAEEQRRLPQATVEALVGAGFMRMCVPEVYGGPEARPTEMFDAIAEVSAVDGAAGWCVMIASTTSSMSLFLAPEQAELVFGDEGTVTGGVYAPHGRVEAVDGEPGALRVTGRWAWGSGTQHCRWVCGGALGPDGTMHLGFFDIADVTFHDTWHVVGLRGTGSVDFSVDGAYVPHGRWLTPGVTPPQVEVPLAAFPNFSLLASGVAAVAIGIARHAIDELVEIAAERRPLFSSRPLGAHAGVQSELSRVEADIGAAKAYVLDRLAAAWDDAVAGRPVDVAHRSAIRGACIHAVERSVHAVDQMFALAGGASVYESNVLGRCLRDVHVARQHLMVAPRLHETLGRIRLGIDPPGPAVLATL
jgi:indole-3-acetate monooxygenase